MIGTSPVGISTFEAQRLSSSVSLNRPRRGGGRRAPRAARSAAAGGRGGRSSLRPSSARGLLQPRLRDRDRRRQLADARARCRGRRRAGRGRSRWCCAGTGCAFSSVGASSLTVSARLSDSAARAPAEGVEVGDQVLELLLAAEQRVEDAGVGADQLREVARLGARAGPR